jgi:hypothetical protein
MVNMVVQKLEGVSMPAESFRVHESSGVLNMGSIYAVIEGELAAYHVKKFLSPSQCEAIVSKFWSSPYRLPRPDGVEGYYIGAYHYGKSTNEYLEQVAATRSAVAALYEGLLDPADSFRSQISSSSERLVVRAAEARGMKAGGSRVIHWAKQHKYLLKPHDDLGQLRTTRQKDFEIQKVSAVIAINIYPEVPKDSGQVRIWNIQPNDATRNRLGISETGFPYPDNLLEAHENITIKVTTGDICLFNGAQIHAVLNGNPMASGRRLLITFFMGLLDSNTLIWWT